jgi:hypothetical protein
MTDDNVIHLTESQLRQLMAETVEATLLKMGVDTKNPMEMQRDFKHLREWRTTVATVRRGGILAFVSVLVSGALGLIWIGIKNS